MTIISLNAKRVSEDPERWMANIVIRPTPRFPEITERHTGWGETRGEANRDAKKQAGLK